MKKTIRTLIALFAVAAIILAIGLLLASALATGLRYANQTGVPERTQNDIIIIQGK